MSAVHTARARVAALNRHHGPDSPDTVAAHRDLRAARAEQYLRDLIASAPPLTQEQIGNLRSLLSEKRGASAA